MRSRLLFRFRKWNGGQQVLAVATASTVVAQYQQFRSRADARHIASPIVPVVVASEKEKDPSALAVKSAADLLRKSVERVFYRIVLGLEKLVRYLSRFLTVSVIATPLVAMGPVTYLLGDTAAGHSMESLTMDYVCWALGFLGPAFIKMAQWASSRPDIYSPMVIEKLSKFQDGVEVKHSPSVVEHTLTEAFGAGWRDKLSIDFENPIGTGCIAQVFRGILEDAGEKVSVAIKVIHPHVEGMIKTDMEILAGLASVLDMVPMLEMLSLGETCRQFGRVMNEQLDMTVEANNLIKFASKWGNEKWASFPKPIEGLISKNVLVETLMEGKSIVSFMQLRDDFETGAAKLKQVLSDLGARAMIKMIFFDNFVHGDMHPGNILVNFDKDGKPHLVFLDCGIVYYSKTEREHNALVDICVAFMQHDGRKAARLMIDNNPGVNKVQNAGAFIEAVQQLVDEAESHSYFEHVGEYVVRICDLARVHQVRLDPNYFHIAMALKVVEGISLSLDKDLDLISKCLPVIIKAKALKALGRDTFSFVDDIKLEEKK